MSSWHGGKGSKQRPIQDRKAFEDNWDLIFGKNKLDKIVEEAQEQGIYDDPNPLIKENNQNG